MELSGTGSLTALTGTNALTLTIGSFWVSAAHDDDRCRTSEDPSVWLLGSIVTKLAGFVTVGALLSFAVRWLLSR